MKDRQFLEFMNMLEALRLTMRQQVTDKPIIVSHPDLPGFNDVIFRRLRAEFRWQIKWPLMSLTLPTIETQETSGRSGSDPF
ncbi:hypothetical protein LCGC14_1133350 [marine sediment metagenome]|uniref:Uncharacterized protein n=1 Tax=marine sediment metagenome TaxID=412755 RepID=A0A0F9M5D9_9ZZZZ